MSYWRRFLAEWRLLLAVLLTGVGSLVSMVVSMIWFGQFLTVNQPVYNLEAVVRAGLFLLAGGLDLWWATSPTWRPWLLRGIYGFLAGFCLIMCNVNFAQFLTANQHPGFVLLALVLLVSGLYNLWKFLDLLNEISDRMR